MSTKTEHYNQYVGHVSGKGFIKTTKTPTFTKDITKAKRYFNQGNLRIATARLAYQVQPVCIKVDVHFDPEDVLASELKRQLK